MKRLLLALLVLAAVATAGYGHTATRRERAYRQLIAHGDDALGRGDTFAAVTKYGEAVASRPDAMLGYLKRGDAYRARGDWDAAAADLETARTLHPAEPRVLELLGDVAAARKRHGEAAEHYRQHLRLDERARILYKLGLSEQLAGRHAEAADALRGAVRIDPRFAEAHYLLGLCLRDLGQLPAAQASLERAVAVAPTLSSAREQLADVYGAAGRRAERIRQLEALLSADPSAGRQVALALAYADAGQLPRAVRILGLAAGVYPDYPGTYIALGEIWLGAARSTGDRVARGKAVEALLHAVSMDPSSRALTLLGEARLLDGDVAAAERTLRQATETLPAEPEAFALLARAAGRLGHHRTARRAQSDYDALVRR